MKALPQRCLICEISSSILGKKAEMFLLHEKWKKIYLNQVDSYLKGLDLKIVGGLHNRGWTIHDVDIVGTNRDVPIFARRLTEAGIENPVHYCGRQSHRHILNHLLCLKNGAKLILFHKGY